MYQYVSYATSSFEEHSTLGIIQTAQAIIVAVSRPLVSKVRPLTSTSRREAELTLMARVLQESLLIGLGWSFLIAVVLYCAGCACSAPSLFCYTAIDALCGLADAVVAASPSIAVYAVGTLAAQLGNSALVSLQSVRRPRLFRVLVAEHSLISIRPQTAIFTYSTSLGNNALLQSILSMPYYITGWVASFIVEGILKTTTWRWGYGMCVASCHRARASREGRN